MQCVCVYSLCSLSTSSTQVRIFKTSATTTAEEARYRGPSACRVREYRMVSTRVVVWNTRTPRETYFSLDEAMSTARWDDGQREGEDDIKGRIIVEGARRSLNEDWKQTYTNQHRFGL